MWNFTSNPLSRNPAKKNGAPPNCTNPDAECSDDEVSSCASREAEEEGLECPICWEFFNMVENVPYVLWCGHTMCKNCVLGLQCAVIKFPNLPLQLPFFISCPWCNLLSFRFTCQGNLAFPRKNFFLLWMVEGMNGEREKSILKLPLSSSSATSATTHEERDRPLWPSSTRFRSGGQVTCGESSESHSSVETTNQLSFVQNLFSVERVRASFRKSLAFLVRLTAKFPLVFIFLLIVLYAIPASVAVLVLHILITLVFAMPSFLVLYFAYPSLDWLLREIFA